MTAIRRDDRLRAREALIERHLPLARYLAAHHLAAGEPFDDVFQVACIGLIKAADRFDRNRGVAFSSYATPTIVGEIKRYYRDHTWVVHVPRDLLELSLRADRVADELAAERGRPATDADIATRLHIGDDEVRRARDASRARRTTSLEYRGSHEEDARTISDTVGAEEPGFEAAEQGATLDLLLRCLPPRDREIVRLRFSEDLTQEQISWRVHLSQMQVSRVLRAGLERLQARAAATA